MTGAPGPALHVVLVEPEIPPNTGNIARLCAATGTRLHLVRPLGFSLEDRYLKRAGLDYWPHVDLVVHDDWPSLRQCTGSGALFFFSTRARRSYLGAPYAAESHVFLVFGRETRGLPDKILAAHDSQAYRIPMRNRAVRSLNLANAVSIVVYEALRQRGIQQP